MYVIKIRIHMPEDIVHKYSLHEWEDLLLAEGQIKKEDLPLSYAFVARYLAQLFVEDCPYGMMDQKEWASIGMSEEVTYAGNRLDIPACSFSDVGLKGR